MEDIAGTLVVDVGGGMTKAGFGGDDSPRAVFPSIVGRPRHGGFMMGMGQKTAYVGDEAVAKRGVLGLKKLITNGIVGNWDDWEQLMSHTFYNELRAAPEEYWVLMSVNPIEPPKQRQKATQIFFETYNVPGYLPYSKSSLALMSAGRTSGISVDMGEESTTIVPVYEGVAIPSHCVCQQFGARDITDYMNKTLSERGYCFETFADKESVRDMKEKLGYVALDFDAEIVRYQETISEDKEYELPDGQVVTVRDERFRCAEPLFKPSLLGKEEHQAGLHELLAALIDRLESLEPFPEALTNPSEDNLIAGLPLELVTQVGKFARSGMLCKDMGTVVLSGGTSMFPGLSERLTKEMKLLVTDTALKVVAPPERKYSVWIGGSIMSTLSTFQQQIITKAEYDENGPMTVEWKGLY